MNDIYQGPVFKPFPHYISVTKNDKGLLNVKTNTHLIEDLHPDQLDHISHPYSGVSCTFELKCEDKELYDKIFYKMEKGTDLFAFQDDEHPVIPQAYANWAWMSINQDRYLSIRSLDGIANGLPILFLGAGSSFLDNKELVKTLQSNNQAIIIAGGSAIRQALSVGIIPDLCLAFDPREHEKTVLFDHISDAQMDKLTWICNQGLYHGCFKRIRHAYVTCSSSLPDMCAFMEPEELILQEGRIGVSTMIPYLAKFMGASELIYLGVDLKLTDDGKRYSDMDASLDPLHHNDIIAIGTDRTKISWQRESVDIVNTSKTIGLKMSSLSHRSLLKDAGLPMCNLSHLKKLRKCKKTVRNLITSNHKNKVLNNIEHKLNTLHSDFVKMSTTYRGYQLDETLRSTDAFFGAIATYDMLQQYRHIRTGDYNHCLLKHVVRNNIKWIEAALKIITEPRFDL